MTELSPTAFLPRRLKIAVIGAGISGIQFAHEITTTLSNIDLEIWDKNPSVGGTWYENRYPGCTCDVPSHTYQFSWAPNPNWSMLYPPASEIKDYLESTVQKHDLRKFIRFNWKCISTQWNEDTDQWITQFENTLSGEMKRVVSDVLVYAVGRLNNYRIPEVADHDKYKGIIVHTAAWPNDLDVCNKKVVVVGNGASAVQCVPALQPVVSHLTNIAQSPTWIMPHVFSEDGASQQEYSSQEKRDFISNMDRYYQHCVRLEKKLAAGFPGLWRGTSAQAQFNHKAKAFMHSKITDPKILRDLMPDFDTGCRRFTPGEPYLNALHQPNVKYVRDSIVKLTSSGLIGASGSEYECDILVYATGFEPYKPRFSVLGRDGVSLNELWSPDGPCESYMAAMVAQFPNMFVFNPPICPVNGSAIPGIERAANYMVRVISRLQNDDLRSLCVRSDAQAEFNEWVQSRMSEMVWTGPCRSWYKNKKGKVVVPWPGTILHYYAATQIIRWEDFDLRFRKTEQKYNSFGNGVTLDGFVPESFPWIPDVTLDPSSRHKGAWMPMSGLFLWQGYTESFRSYICFALSGFWTGLKRASGTI